jgi:hypothetical protein
MARLDGYLGGLGPAVADLDRHPSDGARRFPDASDALAAALQGVKAGACPSGLQAADAEILAALAQAGRERGVVHRDAALQGDLRSAARW